MSRGVLTEELSRQGPGAIRGKRLPSTRTSKHEHPKPGAHLACSQTSKNTSLTGMLGKGTWEKWGQEASGWVTLDTGPNTPVLVVTLRSKVLRVL